MKRDYLSYSALKAFAKSPNHYLAYINREVQETAAMVLGTAAHCAILEPQSFQERYAVAEKVDRRTKAGKEAWQRFQEDSAGKIVLTSEQNLDVLAMADGVNKNDEAAALLRHCKFEQPVEGEIGGVTFKGVADAIAPNAVIDLKTSADASPNGFGRQAANLGYFMQAAIYRLLTGVDKFYWIVVENSAPYNVSVFKPDEESLIAAEAQLYDLIEAFKAWDGEPAGYAQHVETLTLPLWHEAWKHKNAAVAPRINGETFEDFLDSL